MLVDRKSPIHLYVQIAESIRQKVLSGEFAGGALPSEAELCRQYGVSRFPMRQAMAQLVKESVVSRARGKGTFASCPADMGVKAPQARSKTIALVMPWLDGDFAADILKGFEHASSAAGYTTALALSGSLENETAGISRVVENGAAGVVVLPIDNSSLDRDCLEGLVAAGVYVSVIDRNPGMDHIDYIGSDNSGGGYLAARHMSLHGFRSAVFVSGSFSVSSLQERFCGFCRGLRQFGMRLLNAPPESSGCGAPEADAYDLAHFLSRLEIYGQDIPFAVFAGNDEMAEQVMSALRDKGLQPGSDVGVIGFDNVSRDDYLAPQLTSVAQSGYLIGETAAELAVQKIESGSKQSVRHILPTQLIARRSCGEITPPCPPAV